MLIIDPYENSRTNIKWTGSKSFCKGCIDRWNINGLTEARVCKLGETSWNILSWFIKTFAKIFPETLRQDGEMWLLIYTMFQLTGVTNQN